MRSCFLMTLMALAAFTFMLTFQQAQSASLSFLMPANDKRFVLLRSAVAFGDQETEMPGDQETTEAPEENNIDGPQKTSSEGYQENVSGATTVNPESSTENETTAGPKARSEMEAEETQEPLEAVTVEAQETTTEQPNPFELYTHGVDTLATEETDIETAEVQKSTTDFRSQDQETHAPLEAETETVKPDLKTLSEAEDKTTETQEIVTNQTELEDENVTETPEPEEA